MNKSISTTIVVVRRDGEVAMAGDGSTYPKRQRIWGQFSDPGILLSSDRRPSLAASEGILFDPIPDLGKLVAAAPGRGRVPLLGHLFPARQCDRPRNDRLIVCS